MKGYFSWGNGSLRESVSVAAVLGMSEVGYGKVISRC